MKWDFIIIGAGSAGCALAYELARSSDRRVLVLEAGGHDSSPYIRIPACQPQATARYGWPYQCEPDASRNGQCESWVRGKVVGGSSSVNGTMYVRGAAADFDRWAAAGNPGWSFAEVEPLFREMETSDLPGAHRGRQGPLYVGTVRRPHPLARAFVAATQQAGFPLNEDYNGASQEGVGYAQLTRRRGLRCSAANAFLKPALRRPNVKLMVTAHVNRVLMEGARATGVEFERNGALQRESAAHVIVCAGAINSPQLLMLSGLGARADLQEHGIDCVIDLPAVGRHLKDHPLLRLVYRTAVRSNNLTGGLPQKLAIAARFLFTGEGPIANIFEAGAFLRTRPEEPVPDIQLHFVTVGYEVVAGGRLKVADYPAVTVLVNKTHPRSSGRIRLAGADPKLAPKIEANLLGDREDVDTLVRGVRVIRSIMSSAPMAQCVESEVTPGSDLATDEQLAEFVRGNTTIAFHPAGTCRMGAGPGPDAVVDANLRVHGTENLWVADASVLPDLLSGNTNAICMMIGLKLGRYLRQCPT